MSATELKREERALNYLHEQVGVCSHCGKKKCAGKKSGSRLPETINTTIVLEAIRLASIPLPQ